ncbi:unnamed protein product, partial [Prorocentrum cordatum]
EHAGGRPGGRRDPALDGAAEALAARRTSQGALGALRRTLLAGPRGAPLSAVARCAGTARRGGVGAASGGAEAAEGPVEARSLRAAQPVLGASAASRRVRRLPHGQRPPEAESLRLPARRPRAPLCPLRAGPAVAAGAGACPAGHRARCLRVPGPGGAVGPRGACARRRPR